MTAILIRLKAFTLLELIVTLIISSIVILCTYQFFMIIQKIYTKNERENDALKSYLLFNNLLSNDFENSEMAFVIAGKELFLVKSGDTVKYKVDKRTTIRFHNGMRLGEIIDAKLMFFFRTKPVTPKVNICPVDEILCIKKFHHDLAMRFTKNYSATQIMQLIGVVDSMPVLH